MNNDKWEELPNQTYITTALNTESLRKKKVSKINKKVSKVK